MRLDDQLYEFSEILGLTRREPQLLPSPDRRRRAKANAQSPMALII
jgi:hypothetical protein